jgi:hypothetical protein
LRDQANRRLIVIVRTIQEQCDTSAGTCIRVLPNGYLSELSLNFDEAQVQAVPLGMRDHGGPRLEGIWNGSSRVVQMTADRSESLTYSGHSDGIDFALGYAVDGRRVIIDTRVVNTTGAEFAPETLALYLNIDTYMERFPDWNYRAFPTLLRCEKTHFWGYYMSPLGQIITVSSPDPIAAWRLVYNKRRSNSADGLLNGGHRVYGVGLSLINAPPLPSRHPELHALQAGEERRWRVILEPTMNLDEVLPIVARNCDAPLFDLDRHTVGDAERVHVHIFGRSQPLLTVADPSGATVEVACEPESDGAYVASILPATLGAYTLRATIGNKTSEAIIHHRRPWSWYLDRGRAEGLRYLPDATCHNESWTNFATWFLARRYLPDAKLDTQADQVFLDLFPQIFDLETGATYDESWRIQNGAMMAGFLALRYAATGDEQSLEWAQPLVRYIVEQQRGDGAFYSLAGVHYTSVGYMAKGIMELMEQEKKLAADSPRWAERYESHRDSVRRAIRDLLERADNIGTEGEHTFEDGMISCSVLQLALYALVFPDDEMSPSLVEAAVRLDEKHRCLTYSLMPDARMFGATLRFWEAQYNVLIYENVLNSPCGWSSWKILGQWYLYQLTGRVEYLNYAMDALGTCAQLVDTDSGELRWGFIPDPYVRTLRHIEHPKGSGSIVLAEDIIGEQYEPMVNDWYRGQNLVRPIWCIDNLVHEVFKTIGEVALRSAYVFETEDDVLLTWNCTVTTQERTLSIAPNEDLVDAVNVNLRNRWDARVAFSEGARQFEAPGFKWLCSDGSTARRRPE